MDAVELSASEGATTKMDSTTDETMDDEKKPSDMPSAAPTPTAKADRTSQQYDTGGGDPIEKRKERTRPKRIRKRPRSETQANANLIVETTVKHLEMNDTPILEAGSEQFFRVVHPYPYTFASFCKKRWIGRTVLDVYVSEFGSYPESYYRAAITQGRILISDKKVDLSYKIQEKDELSHTVHRHEPAVAVCLDSTESLAREKAAPDTSNQETSPASSSLIKIVDETDDLIIVDKPGTLPVHPCGGYHLNSLTSILEGGNTATHPTTSTHSSLHKHYYTIHRLDRLTSGLVILAKSSEVAKHWSQCIRQRDCQKYYLARVRGRWPLHLEHGGGGGLERIQAGNSSTCVPQDGEWPSNIQTATKSTGAAKTIDDARNSHAHGYWISDVSGNAVRDDVSLSDLANAEINNVDECLKELGSGKRDPLASNNGGNRTANKSMLWLHLACPTRIVKPKNGVCSAGRFHDLEQDLYLQTVKPAQTSFAVIKYDATTDSTLILCRPVTGRTHQIRLHCEYLGHPIGNDPNYGGDIWYGNQAGREACAKARSLLDYIKSEGDDETEVAHKNISDAPASVEEIDQLSKLAQRDNETAEDFIKRTCVWCARCRGRDVVDHCMLEFLVRSRGIWLHALQYCIEPEGQARMSFRTELPAWA